MTVYAAARGYAAYVEHGWLPSSGALALELEAVPTGGSAIFPESTGHLPGLAGRLNPVHDSRGRTYLYASNIAINEGQAQPVHFAFGENIHVADSNGAEWIVRILDVAGRASLIDYRSPRPRVSALQEPHSDEIR